MTIVDKERESLKETAPKNIPLGDELKAKLKEILVKGDIHELLHWDWWGQNPSKELIRITPEETEVLVDNVLFTEKQMEVLRLRLGTEVNIPMTTMEAAEFLGISHGAAYMREYGMIGRLKRFLEAIRNPKIEVFLTWQNPHNAPGISLSRPGDHYRRSSVLRKLEIKRNNLP